MNFLFVHNNFPAQFVHLAPALADRGHRVVAIGGQSAPGIANIPLHKYTPVGAAYPGLKHAHRFQTHVQCGLGVAAAAQRLVADGFVPDLIFGHIGWGETIFLKDIWPAAKLALYAEFYYAGRGLDVGFDPELEPPSLERDMLVRARNGGLALAMANADYALAPTEFQRSVFPAAFQDRIVVQHDGVDCQATRPRANGRFVLPSGACVLTADDEVVTYVNRHLEPMRGIHVFLRALPALLAQRPKARIVVIGADSNRPYGPGPGQAKSWVNKFLEDLGPALDLSRIHFVGSLPRVAFLDALSVSRAHVYLTAPFVLSWSLIDALAMGCAIVASDTPPVREVIRPNENGVLVDFSQPQALAEAVAAMLADPARAKLLGKQARADAEGRYSLKDLCLPRLVQLAETWAAAPSQ